MQISDLENIISEKIFIKIEKWNLYLGDAGLARNLALECISNLDKGSQLSLIHISEPTRQAVINLDKRIV